MKNWWSNLSFREKQTVSMGAALLLIFLIYEIIFAPLSSHVNSLRQKVRSNQALLHWMQDSDARISSLEKTQKQQTRNTSTSLLSVVQNGINNSAIAQNVTQLQQSENDSVQMKLQKVGFDTFIQWLTAICQQQQLIILQMTSTPDGDPGTVDLELKIQRA
jgi:type II secretory pathway component PulM